ncbi:hypothetical protein [Ensifer soli]|uniref:hypothetical protein n=1 Tax=Ciceribacter sp. sgz301302 TaxID=3342379 RepID=UPI0035B80068
MLKLLITGVWVCSVTLGAVYFSVQHASAPPVSEADAERRANEEYVPGDLITIPAIGDGGVRGYFLTKLSFSARKDKLKTLDVPLKNALTDALYDTLVGERIIDVTQQKSFELQAFKDMVKDGINRNLHGEVIWEVYVEQLEFLTKDDVTRIANSTDTREKPVPLVDRNGTVANDHPPGKAGGSTGGH